MPNAQSSKPGLPAAEVDSLDSDKGADDPIEDEHHIMFA